MLMKFRYRQKSCDCSYTLTKFDISLQLILHVRPSISELLTVPINSAFVLKRMKLFVYRGSDFRTLTKDCSEMALKGL